MLKQEKSLLTVINKKNKELEERVLSETMTKTTVILNINANPIQ